ncbi:uncharacterized protein LOC129591493 [Paramacrobiotus metropolitanus]|uniref:uncharacterized protein LOC129591493 n=1 Tax=Paramacrobiotus metropolitanus TaxID=2943436 RepID=UPI0024465BAD|nr:uncharacterized protein LOC129591493 [Paramacrobiotus metropolitanus]
MVYKGEPVLKRFITRFTRHVILRWPLDTCPPEAELIISSNTYGSHYQYNYWGPISRSLDNIIRIVEILQRSLGNTISTLTLQNLKLYVNHWDENRKTPVIRDAFPVMHYDCVQINCHFEPLDSAIPPRPLILCTEVDKIDLISEKDPPQRSHHIAVGERFGRFLSRPLSLNDEVRMDRALRSPTTIGWKLDNYWKIYFGSQAPSYQSLAEMELTLAQIRSYPLWKQYLARNLLQCYIDDANEKSGSA